MNGNKIAGTGSLSPLADFLSVATQAMAELGRDLWRDVFDPYRPEQHYMRGPGPAWQAKHAAIRQPTK